MFVTFPLYKPFFFLTKKLQIFENAVRMSSFLAAKAIVEKPTNLKFLCINVFSLVTLVFSQHGVEVDMTNLVSTPV